MKILFVTGIFPPDHGGPASYVAAIAHGLQKVGHDIVAVITLSDQMNHDDEHYEFPVVRLKRERNHIIRWFQTVLTIWIYARTVDVVYLNGLVLEGILATKFIRRRSVVVKVVGDLIWERARNQRVTEFEIDAFQTAVLPIKWRLLRQLQSWYIGQTDAVITPSRYLADIVSGWGIASSRITVVYNAVKLPPDMEPRPSAVDIVTIARLVSWKGLADLIKIVAEHGWSLRIIGDGPLREELELLVKNLNASVFFAGHVPKDRITEEIRSARLFVLFSSYEGLPHVVLEAKAAGSAVIASAAGGTPETIHHMIDGWLVSVGNCLELTAAIERLLNDNELRLTLAKQGRNSVKDNFNFAYMVRETATVLQRTML